LAVIIAQTLAQAPVTTKSFTNGTGIIQKRTKYAKDKVPAKREPSAQPCIYKDKKYEIEPTPLFPATSAGQCQKLCQAVNRGSSETKPKCLAWTFEDETTSC